MNVRCDSMKASINNFNADEKIMRYFDKLD